MFESPHKQQRHAADKVDRYRREADIAHSLSAAGIRHGWRWRLGETLFALAGRLSPEHRTLIERLCDPPLPEPEGAA